MQEFLFSAPLYAVFWIDKEQLQSVFGANYRARDKMDGWCPLCHRESTFELSGGVLQFETWAKIESVARIQDLELRCARRDHILSFYFLLSAMRIQKIGQYPSLATIAQDETQQYRRVLKDDNATEFHKAVGLAAHGVGVGSFVYLRRVFERLIWARFREFEAQEAWDEAQFKTMRMEDKIGLLKGHLPVFLVENCKVYSILSLGVHELDEGACLAFFPVMKDAIVMILEDDKKKREELERREHMRRAIAAYEPNPADT